MPPRVGCASEPGTVGEESQWGRLNRACPRNAFSIRRRPRNRDRNRVGAVISAVFDEAPDYDSDDGGILGQALASGAEKTAVINTFKRRLFIA